MRVSVVVPTLDAGRYLDEALASIESQTRQPFEVIVVDGGSTDETLAIAAARGVRVIRQPGSGLADAWNAGIAAAAGDAIAFLDSDDRWLTEKLGCQIPLLAENVDCVITRMRFVLEPGCVVPPGFRAELLHGDHLAQMPSALLARRSVFDRIGVFDGRWPIATDIDWFARAKDAALRVEVVPTVLVEKRVHDANLSTLGGTQLNRELIEVLRASIARRRH